MSFNGGDTDQMRTVASGLSQLAGELDGLIGGLVRRAHELAWTGPDASQFHVRMSAAASAERNMLVAALRSAADDLRRNASAQDEVSATLDGTAGSNGSGGASTVPPSADPCSIPPVGDPAGAAEWWAKLTPEQQRFVIEHQPQLVGALDGIPPEVRFEANRVLIGDLIEELKASGASQATIDHLQSFLEPYAGHERQILLFDPSGDGRIAEVFGDISTAKDIAVVVPGIGNSMANYSPENAYQLHQASPDGTASIMWLGYDTPNGPTDMATFTAIRAASSAESLTTFTSGLHTVSNAEVTLVAHSYGSVVAGEAGKLGMSVERVVLIGSPGIPADNASVFNGAAVYAINNQLDPVGLSGSHGTNPTDASFGAHVLPGNAAEVHSSPVDAIVNPIGTTVDYATAGLENHSTYFDEGSTSLHSIVSVLDDNRPAPDGMSVQRIHNSDGSAEDVYLSSY